MLLKAVPIVIVIILTIAAGLYLDVAFPWGQTAVNIWVWALYALLLFRSKPLERAALLLCLFFATLGEFLLSIAWGLYEYRNPGIPLYVFPGHCLLFAFGVKISQKVPRQTVWLVPLLASPYILYAAFAGFDTEGLLWFVVFVLCLKYGPAKKLYATMFVLALIMEIYGTWLGNWRWAAEVPGLGLSSTNPPVCAGIFYCLLDLIVTAIIGRAERKPA